MARGFLVELGDGQLNTNEFILINDFRLRFAVPNDARRRG
jgi:hypothetical protein